MIDCSKCGFWDIEYEACTCPSQDRWYACPNEGEKPENQQALKEYAEWTYKTKERRGQNDKEISNVNRN